MKLLKCCLATLLTLVFSLQLHAATFVVNSTLDTSGTSCSSPCTLRQAIAAANLTTAADTINFGFRISGEILIQPNSALPTITQSLTINGYSQNGTSVNTDAIASNAVLRIRVDGLNAGALASGFLICTNDVTIKGLSITRFSQQGVDFGFSGTSLCATAPGNGFVYGNFMGLTTDGTTAAGNAASGIRTVGVPITIGSNARADRNISSSNGANGIDLQNIEASNSIILGNLIGTDKTANLNRGNAGLGVIVRQAASTTIGSSAAPNLIAYNSCGIEVRSGLNNRLNFNRFVSNDGLGIELLAQPGDVAGVSLNDNGDGDAGGNGQQNYLDDGFAVARTATGINIQGTLRRIASSNITFTIAAYASATCDSSLHGEGEQFLGTATEVTSTGVAPINVDIPLETQPPIGSFITTTVTSPGGSTSEFSTCFQLEMPLVVNSLNDVADGVCNAAHCSLRDAIIVANATPAPDLIKFNISSPASGELMIQPNSALPTIIAPLLIDGYSQSGAAANTLSMAQLASNAVPRIRLDGLNAGAGADGFNVCSNDFSARGLSITRFQNAFEIGGDNQNVSCSVAPNNATIVGNFLGVTTDGASIAQNSIGVFMRKDAQGVIGGVTSNDRNIISGNNTGVFCNGETTLINRVLGNLIGSDKTGQLDKGNVGTGIRFTGTVDNVLIGDASAPNLIRFNRRGIEIELGLPGEIALNNRFLANYISSNDLLGIDLEGDGVSNNDANDIDSGPNGLQNFPVISRAERTATGLLIEGFLDVKTSAGTLVFDIAVYANSTCDASGHGEGERYLGSATVALRNLINENFMFTLVTADLLEPGVQITSTATGAEGSSEFSACVPAADPVPGIVVDSVLDIGTTALGCDVFGDANECTLREAITMANSNVDASLIRFDISGNGPHVILVTSLLPAISAPLTIDGYSQTGVSENAAEIGTDANLDIQLRKGGTGSVLYGLMTCSSDVTIRGLVIGQFNAASIATQMNASANCAVVGNNVHIAGNFIGVLSNGVGVTNNIGILVANTQVVIGGPTLADRNIISSNLAQGVRIAGAGSDGSVVQNNLIGTGLLPSNNLGNGGAGIEINGSSDVIVGGSGVLANTLRFNAQGIVVLGAGTGNQLAANDFAGNTALAIDLASGAAANGVTPNDINDVDTGPNNLQNFPVLSDASATTSSITVNGTLDVPVASNNTPYQITLYESASCDSSGNGEGNLRLSASTLNLSAAAENFSITLKVAPNSAASVITATATDPLGNTSEFSNCIAAPQRNSIFSDGFE